MDGRCAVRFTRRYDAAVEEIWHALTDPASLERWLAPPPGGTVKRAEPERVLELEWSPPGEPPSQVRIELQAEGDRTVLVLEHTRIDATLGMRYMRHWANALDRFDEHFDQQRRQG